MVKPIAKEDISLDMELRIKHMATRVRNFSQDLAPMEKRVFVDEIREQLDLISHTI